MIYYTADLHFGYKKILGMDKRPFETIEEHDRFLIERWNARVRPEDQVYILGDFCVYSKNSALSYLVRLNGRKYLVTGNHDRALLKDAEAVAQFEAVDKMLSVRDGQYHGGDMVLLPAVRENPDSHILRKMSYFYKTESVSFIIINDKGDIMFL